MRVIATTTQSRTDLSPELQAFLRETGIEFVPRGKKSLAKIKKEKDAEGIVIWQEEGPVLYIDEKTRFYFHPSMAKVRISNYRKFNQPDPMIQAMELEEDDKVLDCTLGLGADAIVASYFASQGRIVGLEYSPLVASIIKWGMKMYRTPVDWLDRAIKRIEVVNVDYREYLSSLKDNSFDIVYFDPMFRKPILKSQAISPLRLLACLEPVAEESLREALRVARKKVVMKELYASGELKRLGFTKIVGSPNNKIAYGVIEKKH
ncbi:Putative SAM-dependent methyltransferase [Thermosyntropha lipolytica DSM 11003]|uniref:Putative SAM-dependent methyltransferase n=1 Tax=Thermosyntropha lipolytica DSM 11003 TaxID=1123382 RepID=A0A1M5PNA2_9FIRM|nr:class I SAM-dependent methyltransferase [Thermosyntropha lipolytica]SHH02703.1 Putative SAM-dependent methyltransferase [Thermosyntropha lipolytica DSM 11003]